MESVLWWAYKEGGLSRKKATFFLGCGSSLGEIFCMAGRLVSSLLFFLIVQLAKAYTWCNLILYWGGVSLQTDRVFKLF